ncbi:GTP-binding protein yptV3 [Sarcoptes scabiei]|uniref:GTP-binding protein yptV3 n=1 Tax=Sarcoptes scabiei TaxID=52283 RepID=A0A834R1M8_SARSC|nr:GTP-binding protein yptV3 [Sarcoptes scabiei]
MDDMMDHGKIIKVNCLIVGSHAVGKTTLISRLMNSTIKKDYELSTRVFIDRKSYSIAGIKDRIEMIFFDFPGKQIYRNVLYRMIQNLGQPMIMIGIFDVTNRSSLNQLEQLFQIFNKNLSQETSKLSTTIESSNRFIIANKIDLIDKRIISTNEIQSIAKKFHCPLLESSIGNDLTIKDIEQTILEIIKSNISLSEVRNRTESMAGLS